MKSSEIPALKLFVLLFGFSLLFSYMKIDMILIAIISFISLIVGFFLIKYSKKSLAYLIWIAALGLLTSVRFDNDRITIPDKIIPEQKGLFSGTITQLLRNDKKYIRYIAEGDLNTDELQTVKDTKILLTIFSPKFALLPGDKFISDISISFPEGKLPDENFDYEAYYKSNEIQWVATTYGRNIFKIDEKDYFKSTSYNLRYEIKKRIFSVFDSTSAGIMTALLTGDKTMIGSETKRKYSLSGTAHLLAVSGLHVGIISFIIFTMFSFVTNQILKTCLTIFSLGLFVFMTGWLESALRATIMISVYLISQNFEQKVNPLNSLSVAALIMFVWNPDVIYSISFRMSLLSVTGIVLFYEKFRKTFSDGKKYGFIRGFIINSFSITLAASVLISPIVAYYFGVYSLISPFANLIVVPIVMLSLSLGICALVFSFISGTLASIYAYGASFLLNLTDIINSYSISFSFSYIEGNISIFIALAVSILLVYIAIAESFKLRIFRISVSAIFIVLISLNIPQTATAKSLVVPRQYLTAVFLKDNDKEYLLMLDRKPANKTKSDFGLRNFILNKKGDIIVAYSGNAGIATIDAVKKVHKFDYFEINNVIQNKIINLLNYNIHPVKMINLQ